MAMSRSFGVRSLTTRPPIEIVPSEISSSPATMRSAVVLPQPDGPDEDEELAVQDVERQVFDRLDVARVDLVDVLEGDFRHLVLQSPHVKGRAVGRQDQLSVLAPPRRRRTASPTLLAPSSARARRTGS